MEFPSNSQNPLGKKKPETPPEKKVEKVVTGKVAKRKIPLTHRFKDIFARGEFRQAVHFVTVDVLLPSMRNLIVDATSKGIERLVYGDTRQRRSGGYNGGTRVSYNDPVNRLTHPGMSSSRSPQGMLPPSRSKNSDDILLERHEDAQHILETLADLINTFDAASVADLNNMIGLPASYVDEKWGWVHLMDADIMHTRQGYLLRLPPIEPLPS